MRRGNLWFAAITLILAGIAVGIGGTTMVEKESHARAVTQVAAPKPELPPPSPTQLNQAETIGHTFAAVASQVSPSVVRITVTSKVERPQMGPHEFPFGNPFKGSPFEHFFDEFGDGGNQGRSQPQLRMGLGSGVVIDSRGFILTNNHVVDDAETVKVTFIDGREVKAKIVGKDPKSDLAVVKVDGVDVKPARLGNPDQMQVGDWVIAIGNPFGLDHTVTVGVLSAKNRSGFESGHYEDFLQTDASINPGNSGGPLVDLSGNVIGINTMIAGIGTGIGFAVPMSMAKPIADQLIATGKVKRPWLGIAMQDVTPELQKSIGKNAPEKGAIVSQVQKDSPAQKAGLKSGDIITAVDAKPVKASRDVQLDVLRTKIGDKVDLAVWRDGKAEHVEAKTAELPASKEEKKSEGAGPTHEKLGLELQTLTPDIRQQLDLPGDLHGAVIAGVIPGSAAAMAGLKEGDVIVEVDRKAIATAEDAAHALHAERTGGHLLRIRRGESAMFVIIPKEE